MIKIDEENMIGIGVWSYIHAGHKNMWQSLFMSEQLYAQMLGLDEEVCDA